jgi:hypothetical protein
MEGLQLPNVVDFVSFLGACTYVMLKDIKIHSTSVEIIMNVKGYTICHGPARM